MFKFLFYLLLIYLIYRILFGRYTGTIIKTKVYRNETHHYHNTQDKESEGRVTVNPKVTKQQSGNSGKMGEYVDYEEIK